MSHDLQMARGAADGEFNLAIGEPVFLQRLLLNYARVRGVTNSVQYPRIGGDPELVEELHRHHDYEYIVVTNGCKQAISAAFYAFKTVTGATAAYHKPPYWPSYPTLATRQRLPFNPDFFPPEREVVLCVTSPNNPDGRQDVVKMADLWDGAYAQPLYGFHGIKPAHQIGVFSAAKQFGLSGIRVGWLGTNEPEYAAAASYFVEITTSGVSNNSQGFLAATLKAFRDPDQMGELTERSFEARAALMTNGNLFNEIISPLVEGTRGVPVDGSGMFAWFKARDPERFKAAVWKAKVKLVSGEACGELEPGWYRMSMGLMPEDTRKALVALREAYEAL